MAQKQLVCPPDGAKKICPRSPGASAPGPPELVSCSTVNARIYCQQLQYVTPTAAPCSGAGTTGLCSPRRCCRDTEAVGSVPLFTLLCFSPSVFPFQLMLFLS